MGVEAAGDDVGVTCFGLAVTGMALESVPKAGAVATALEVVVASDTGIGAIVEVGAATAAGAAVARTAAGAGVSCLTDADWLACSSEGEL